MPPTKRPKGKTGPWSSPRVFNSSSPIVKTDIHAFLVRTISGWNSGTETYTEAEKRSIIDSLPPAYQKYEVDGAGHLTCPLATEFVLDDPYIKAAVQGFKTDITEGYYEKTWQNQARKAMQERRDGKFDPYLHEHTEDTFGDPGLDCDDLDEGVVDAEMESSDGEWMGKKTIKAKAPGHDKRASQSQTQMLRQKRKV
ncbi:hypothetical protein H2200_013564 [Cladophialophora chaetospira]|uniref:ASX DEUBAD domain-containing protein n=1 Tax=Cladophialophora chaetospira TaxID=386627 RepID=A0AA38WUG5_9EURO|nr:hypothetical protein H2200_013564 [Cladophialophora chaetospira]